MRKPVNDNVVRIPKFRPHSGKPPVSVAGGSRQSPAMQRLKHAPRSPRSVPNSRGDHPPQLSQPQLYALAFLLIVACLALAGLS